MKCMLIFHGSKADFDRRTDPKKGPIFWGEFMAYLHAIQNAGVVNAGAGLEIPENGKIVRVRDGTRKVQDGPYAETTEHHVRFIPFKMPCSADSLYWARQRWR